MRSMSCRIALASTLLAAITIASEAGAACGDRGGPGYRDPIKDRCVGWSDIGKTCGSPPTTRCIAENAKEASAEAAGHGLRAWELGAPARENAKTKKHKISP